MKKTTFTLLIILSIVHFSGVAQNMQIAGRIDGWGNDTLVVYYTDDDHEDTLTVRNGTFVYSVPLQDTVSIELTRLADINDDYYMKARTIELIVTPSLQMNVDGEWKNGQLSYRVKPSGLNDDIAIVRERMTALFQEEDSLMLALFTNLKNASQDEREPVYDRIEDIRRKEREIQKEWAFRYPGKEAAGYFAYNLTELEDFDAVYARLTPSVREGLLKPRLETRIAVFERIRKKEAIRKELVPGKPAPDFTLPDLSGVPFTLSAFKTDKYIVLDFWGSWCGPCREEMPEMKEYYEKHRTKLEIIGIACRDTEESWKKAIRDIQLTWLNVCDGMVSAATGARTLYAMDAFPTKIILSPDKTILSPDKTIIGIYVGNNDGFYKKLDELLK